LTTIVSVPTTITTIRAGGAHSGPLGEDFEGEAEQNRPEDERKRGANTVANARRTAVRRHAANLAAASRHISGPARDRRADHRRPQLEDFDQETV
jgi:hypothetical protein